MKLASHIFKETALIGYKNQTIVFFSAKISTTKLKKYIKHTVVISIFNITFSVLKNSVINLIFAAFELYFDNLVKTWSGDNPEHL